MIFCLRLLLMLPYFIVVAALGLVLCLFRPFNPDNSRLIAKMYATGGQRILGLRVSAEGLENFNTGGPSVIVANHQDNLDLFVLGRILPRRTVSIGKKSLLWIPVFGLMYWLAGNVLIDRGNRRKAMDALSAAITALQERNTNIWIFPEGTRNHGVNMLPFKKGAFHTALRAGVPIVPVCVSSYKQLSDFGRWDAGEVHIQVLPAIATEGMTDVDVTALMQQCFDQMDQCIRQLDHRVLPAASAASAV